MSGCIDCKFYSAAHDSDTVADTIGSCCCLTHDECIYLSVINYTYCILSRLKVNFPNMIENNQRDTDEDSSNSLKRGIDTLTADQQAAQDLLEADEKVALR